MCNIIIILDVAHRYRQVHDIPYKLQYCAILYWSKVTDKFMTYHTVQVTVLYHDVQHHIILDVAYRCVGCVGLYHVGTMPSFATVRSALLASALSTPAEFQDSTNVSELKVRSLRSCPHPPI